MAARNGLLPPPERLLMAKPSPPFPASTRQDRQAAAEGTQAAGGTAARHAQAAAPQPDVDHQPHRSFGTSSLQAPPQVAAAPPPIDPQMASRRPASSPGSFLQPQGQQTSASAAAAGPSDPRYASSSAGGAVAAAATSQPGATHALSSSKPNVYEDPWPADGRRPAAAAAATPVTVAEITPTHMGLYADASADSGRDVYDASADSALVPSSAAVAEQVRQQPFSAGPTPRELGVMESGVPLHVVDQLLEEKEKR